MRIVKAGICYFALVFGTGFLLGPVRIIWVVPRLAMGGIALVLMLTAEFTLVLSLRGMTFTDYLTARDPVSGTAYYLSLLAFAAMPWLLTRK